MPADTYVGLANSYRQLTEVHVGLGGSYRDCTEVYVGSGGVWRKVFEKIVEAVAWTTLAQVFTTIGNGSTVNICGIRLLIDGNAESTNGSGTYGPNTYDWGSPAGSVDGNNFEYSWVYVSGVLPTTTPSAQTTFFPINGTKTWQLGSHTSGRIGVFDLTIGKIGDAGSRKTSRITLEQDIGG